MAGGLPTYGKREIQTTDQTHIRLDGGTFCYDVCAGIRCRMRLYGRECSRHSYRTRNGRDIHSHIRAFRGFAGGAGNSSSEAAADTEPRSDTSDVPSIAEDGTYTSRDDVALYLHTYGRLPSNYITKKEAEELGWKKKQGAAGQLDAVAPGKSIGGSRFGNYEGQLPDKKGRHYYECDINYDKGSRGAERLVYSDDGLIYYTGDHYKTFELLYPQE